MFDLNWDQLEGSDFEEWMDSEQEANSDDELEDIVMDNLLGYDNAKRREMKEYRLMLRNKVLNPSPAKEFEHDQVTLDIKRDQVYELERDLKQGKVVDGLATQSLVENQFMIETSNDDPEAQQIYDKFYGTHAYPKQVFDMQMAEKYHKKQFDYVKNMEGIILNQRKILKKKFMRLRRKLELTREKRDDLLEEIYINTYSKHEDQVMPSDKTYVDANRSI